MDLYEKFQDQGYLIVNGEDLGIDIKSLTRKIIKSLNKLPIKFAKSNEKIDLIKYISHITKNETENEVSSKIYQFLPSLLELYQFCSNDKLLSFLSHLEINFPTLGTVPMIRIDRPKNEFFSTPWHQDYWYSFSSFDSVVLWAPLGEINKSHGYLKILPNSHKEGLIPFTENKNSNEPFTVDSNIDESKSVELKINFGEILIFKQTLLHKSGLNNSDQSRVSIQLRYNKMDSTSDIFSTFRSVHSSYVKNNQNNIK